MKIDNSAIQLGSILRETRTRKKKKVDPVQPR